MKPVWRLRIGLLCLGLAGLILALGDAFVYDQGVIMDPTKDPDFFATFVTSDYYGLWSSRGIVAVALEMIGAISLYLYLMGSRVDKLAYWGMITSILTDGAGFLAFGIMVFVFPEIGAMMNEGTEGAIQIATVMEGAFGTFFLVAMVINLFAIILNAIAIWRSVTLPKLAGVVSLVGFLLLLIDIHWVQVLANVVFAVGGFWVAFGAWNHLGSPEVEEPQVV